MKPRLQGRYVPIGRGLLVLVSVVVVFFLSATAALYWGMHKASVTVPNVVGQPLGQAQEIAHQAGFDLEVRSRVYHQAASVNTVVDQRPRAGMTVKRGQPLRVQISLGPADLGQTPLTQ